MNRIKYKRLKLLAFVCIIILVIEVFYISYCLVYKNRESIYFAGTNALEFENNSYVTVGSNNDNSMHYERAFVSKYNSKKQKTFERLYNVGYNGAFFGVVIDGDNIVSVGSYEKTIDEHEDSIRRALIVKYDKNGDIIFEKDFMQLDNSKFTSILKYNDDYIVTGQSIYKNTHIGDKDGGAILAKYSKDGDLLWSSSFGSSKEAIFNDCIVIDDNIYAVGTDENHRGIIVKFDLDGNYLDYNDYKTTDALGFSGIVNVDDSIYVSGSVKSGENDTDAMIVEYNLDCRYINQTIYANRGIERFNKLVVDNHNNLVAIGTIASLNAKNKKTVGDYNYDGVLAKYDLGLNLIDSVVYDNEQDDFFTDIKSIDDNFLIVGYSSYDDGYMSKFISYSSAFKILEVG